MTVRELYRALEAFPPDVDVLVVVPGDSPPATTFVLQLQHAGWVDREGNAQAAFSSGNRCGLRAESI